MSAAVVASGGRYPVEYTLWVKGLHTMAVTSADGHHIEGSPFTIEVADGQTEAVTSFATGPGLTGGVAGEQLAFTVQARDVRQYEHQVVATNATVVPVVDEVQTIRVASGAAGTFRLTFRGASTGDITVGTTANSGTTLQSLADELGNLDTFRGTANTIDQTAAPSTVAVQRAYANGVVVESPAGYGKVQEGDEIEITFTGPRGDVPLLVVDTPNTASVVETRKGDCPFRSEVQTFTCVYDGDYGAADVSARSFSVRLRDSEPAVIKVTDTLADFVAALDAKGVKVDVLYANSSCLGASPPIDRLSRCQVCTSTWPTWKSFSATPNTAVNGPFVLTTTAMGVPQGGVTVELMSAGDVADGDAVSGAGIAQGTVVTGISGTTVTLSKGALATGIPGFSSLTFDPQGPIAHSTSQKADKATRTITLADLSSVKARQTVTGPGLGPYMRTGTAAAGATVITLTDATDVAEGQRVTGLGVPAGATVATIGVSGNKITLSAPTTAALTGRILTFTTTVLSKDTSASTITLNSDIQADIPSGTPLTFERETTVVLTGGSGVAVGQWVVGAGVPEGTFVTSANSGTGTLTTTLSKPVTSTLTTTAALIFADTSTGTDLDAPYGADKVYVTFNNDKGDLPPLDFDLSGLGELAPTKASFFHEHGGVGGSVDGVHPVWGSFTLGYHGATTSPIAFDATAAEVEAALEAMPTVGGVSVSRYDVGVASTLGPSQTDKTGIFGSYTPLPKPGVLNVGQNTTQHALTYWTVAFDKPCDAATGWTGCPAAIGAAPLLTADSTSLQSKRSPYVQQIAPSILVRRTKPGSPGNDREAGDDLGRIHARLVHATAGVSVDNYEVQAIDCVSPGLLGAFDLTFLGRSVSVAANDTVGLLQTKLQTALNGLWSGVGSVAHPGDVAQTFDPRAMTNGTARAGKPFGSASVTVQSDAAAVTDKVCAERHSAPVLIMFGGALGLTLPELNVTESAGGAHVKVYEVAKGLDSITYAGGGAYDVRYTPTKKGRYAMTVAIGGVEISTDLAAGVTVAPADASAPQSEHTSDAVATEGELERFEIQARDVFDNTLDSSADGVFSVTLEGASDPRAGLDTHVTRVETPAVSQTVPNTDGTYDVTWMPRFAGRYVG